MGTVPFMSEIAVPYFCSLPASPPPWPGVVVLMEKMGLTPQLLRVCERLAGEGYAAVAPDLYWRFGGSNPEVSDAHSRKLTPEDARADIVEVVARVRDLGASTVGITGFCMGGRVTFLVACELADKIKAAAPFYGGSIPIERTAKLKAPLLAFFGEDDPFIPLDTVERLKAELARHRKPAEVIVYPKAPHGFFCNERDSYRPEAARDAWERLKTFFAAHLKR